MTIKIWVVYTWMKKEHRNICIHPPIISWSSGWVRPLLFFPQLVKSVTLVMSSPGCKNWCGATRETTSKESHVILCIKLYNICVCMYTKMRASQFGKPNIYTYSANACSCFIVHVYIYNMYICVYIYMFICTHTENYTHRWLDGMTNWITLLQHLHKRLVFLMLSL